MFGSFQRRSSDVKAKIHPRYRTCTAHCACGNTFVTRSTLAKINVDICNMCHPFFTGKQKFVDTAGRVERFSKKFGGTYSFQKAPPPKATAGAAKK
jgi:large subunit ribosomal protein L31